MTTSKTKPAKKNPRPRRTRPARPSSPPRCAAIAFVEAYIRQRRQRHAGRDYCAGYSAATAYAAGHRALNDVEVKQLLGKRRSELAGNTRLTPDRVLEQLAKIVHADVRQAFDERGNLLPVQDMPDGVAHAITSVEVDSLPERFEEDGAGIRYFGRTAKVKFADKGRRLTRP